ncbi:MAG: hypothetical protein ABIV13_03335 [Fimbriimonadales bacterium]
MRYTIGWFMFAGLLLTGCGGDVRANVTVPEVGTASPGDACYQVYIRAAKSVEDRASKYIGRTTWSPDQRDAVVAASSEAIRIVSGVRNAQFGRTWDKPFGIRENTRGWRTLGRALTWRAEVAIKNEDYADARFCLSVALNIAGALSGSDSHDAAMGLEIVDECLSAIWPALPRFPAGTLQMVSSDTRQALEGGPLASAVITQERDLMLAQIGWVRDRYQERDFDGMQSTLGESVAPTVKYLRELVESPAAEQQAYFNGFAEEIEADIALFKQRLATTPAQWQDEEKRGTRAWMRFTKAFGTPWRVYVKRRAEVRTRLRLLAIDAALLGQFKAAGSVPRDLGGFPASLRTDPYSSRNLVYVFRGVDYKLYSVGPNGIDEGGDKGDITVDR